MSKERYIGCYLGIGPIEEIVRKRLDKFINIVMVPLTIASICFWFLLDVFALLFLKFCATT